MFFFFIGQINNIENMKMHVHQQIGFYDVNQLNNLHLFEEDEILIPFIKTYISKSNIIK